MSSAYSMQRSLIYGVLLTHCLRCDPVPRSFDIDGIPAEASTRRRRPCTGAAALARTFARRAPLSPLRDAAARRRSVHCRASDTSQHGELQLEVRSLARKHADECRPDETANEVAERSSVTYMEMSGRDIPTKKHIALEIDIFSTRDVDNTLAATKISAAAMMIGTPASSRRSWRASERRVATSIPTMHAAYRDATRRKLPSARGSSATTQRKSSATA
ncbi:hypothetical protein [Caballeronia grimmiae]|uniref:hypothetical protein n=1 Tax=Caballeronia grimmiae TaxID=1071679 RepID=UPI0038BC97F8